jgi:hypothetical protein
LKLSEARGLGHDVHDDFVGPLKQRAIHFPLSRRIDSNSRRPVLGFTAPSFTSGDLTSWR